MKYEVLLWESMSQEVRMEHSCLEQVLEKGLLSIQPVGRLVGFKMSLLRPGEENDLRHSPGRANKGKKGTRP